MKKLFLLLILSFFSAQSFAVSCPDGSEPVKSVSADGSYFVYNCGQPAAAPAPAPDSGGGGASDGATAPAPGVPTAASIKAEAVRIAEEKSRAESEASPDAPTAASIAAKAEAVSAAEAANAPPPPPPEPSPAPAPAPAPGALTPDQLAPESAPAPANDDLCGAEESTSTPKDISDGVNISCSGDVEITEAPAPVPTQRPDMFSAAVVKYATTVTSWAEMGIPADIVKKYL